MKQLLTSLLLLLGCLDALAAPAVTPGLPISRYPNRGTPQGPDLFVIGVTNASPATNMNVTFNQVSNAIISGVTSGFLNFETLTNGIRVALSTNANWTFGVTGYVSGTSLNLGVDSSLFTQGFGVGLAPGTTVILVDGATNSIVNRTSVLTSASSVIFTNLQVGLPIRWWGFSSNGAWDVSVPQSHESNTVSRGIEQPFTNTWVMVEAIAFSSGWTNFDSEAQGYTIGPGTNVVFDTNLITRHISVSAAGATGGGDQVWTNENDYVRLVGGSTNSIKVMTNGLQGIAIGDTNRMSELGWPFDGLSFISLLDGTAGHDLNQFIFGFIDPSTNAVYTDISASSGNTTYTSSTYSKTNGSTAMQYDIFQNSGGGLVVMQDAAANNQVGFAVADPGFDFFGGGKIFSAKWNGLDSFFATTNGNITANGSASIGGDQFTISTAGDLTKIRNVGYSWPSAQGAAQTVLTNDGSGNLGWGSVSASGAVFQTNQFTTNVADVAGGFQTPVVGALWFGGTTGPNPLTNGARTGFEYIPGNRSLRFGEVGDGIHPSNLGGQGTNYWNQTNVGVMTVGFGSNSHVKANFSSVLGGRVNLILTNSDNSVIAGGYNNFIDTNSIGNTIGGGGFNQLYGTPTGTQNRHRTISGGTNNVINGPFTAGSVIAGGQNNSILVDTAGFASIGGGFSGDINVGGQYGFIGGGFNNTLGGGVETEGGGVLVGGLGNFVRGDFSFVGGGKGNNILANDNHGAAIVGGASNTIGVVTVSDSTYAFIGGGWQNSIASGSHFSVVGGGFQNTMSGGNTNSFIGGGYINTIDANTHGSAIVHGLHNSLTGNADLSFIAGGVSNQLDAAYTAVVGHFLTNSTTKSVEIGVTNTSKTRIEAFNQRMIGMGTLYASNTFAMPTAATLGLGGYWVGNSNGFLVSVYTLDGTTTAMKILAP